MLRFLFYIFKSKKYCRLLYFRYWFLLLDIILMSYVRFVVIKLFVICGDIVLDFVDVNKCLKFLVELNWIFNGLDFNF